MFQILVVDDKKSIREGLTNFFPWERTGFQLIGAVGSALEALQMIEEECVDVLLTDIVMPEMNGLELIQTVHLINPYIKVIILSAHDKFEFAQQAIQLGAYSYQTKPVDIEKLVGVLQDAEKLLVKEQLERQQRQKTSAFVRQHFYSLLFSGSAFTEADITAHAAATGVPIPDGPFRIFVASPIQSKPKDHKAQLSAAAARIKKLPGVLHVNEEGELLSGLTLSHVQPQENSCFSKLTNRIGFSSEFFRLEQMPTVREEAKTAFYGSRILGKKALFYGEIQLLIEKTPPGYRALEEAVIKGFSENNWPDIDRALSRYFTGLPVKREQPIYLQCMPLIVLSQRFSPLSAAGDTKKMILSMKQASSGKAAEALIKEYFRHLINSDREKRKSSNLIIDRAISYIEAHYPEDITLKTIAEEVYVTPIYLSRLFKEITGTSYIEYLTDTRIRHAKRLLSDLSLRIYDIAGMVGYERKHFGKVFKERTGLTPKEFRNDFAQKQ